MTTSTSASSCPTSCTAVHENFVHIFRRADFGGNFADSAFFGGAPLARSHQAGVLQRQAHALGQRTQEIEFFGRPSAACIRRLDADGADDLFSKRNRNGKYRSAVFALDFFADDAAFTDGLFDFFGLHRRIQRSSAHAGMHVANHRLPPGQGCPFLPLEGLHDGLGFLQAHLVFLEQPRVFNGNGNFIRQN